MKSTGILGLAQLFTIFIGIVRVKVLAVLLGPAGLGIAGLFQTIIDFVKSVTGFGLGFSSVRDIAAAVASNDEKRIAATVLVLRRFVWFTGLLGMLVCVIFSRQLSVLSFGNEAYFVQIRVLSVALLIVALTAGQHSLLQGLRKIGDLAKANVLSACLGLILSSIIYYWAGISGIVYAILGTYLIGLIVSWFFCRRVIIQPVIISFTETFVRGRSMINLGFFMVIGWLTSTASMFAARSFVSHQGDLNTVGFFVAAWSISSMYISAIFDAMGTDFFPRLSAVQNDHTAMRKMVNEQTEIALLLTTPIIIAVVSFLSLIVPVLYSKDFTPTSIILGWQLAGDFFKVLAWPMGYILIAKGKGGIFILGELTWHILFLAGTILGWQFYGFESSGIAFLAAYVVYACIIYFIVRKKVSFTHSPKVHQHIKVFLPLVIAALLVTKFFVIMWVYIIGAGLTILAAIYSYNQLKTIISFNAILAKLRLGGRRK